MHKHEQTGQENGGGSAYARATYVDRPEASAVAGSHVLVERLDGVRTAELTELLVHVVGTATRVVTDPDTEVLDLQRALLVDDVKADDLAVGLLDFLELRKEVPEARLGDDFVGREDAHAVELGRGLRLGGEMATDDLIFFETHLQS